MVDVNLTDAILDKANLAGVFLYGILKGASFRQTNLQKAQLGGDLQGVSFEDANLQEATLFDANLDGVDFTKATIRGLRLENAVFNENTKLPDGTFWRHNADLLRFI